MEKDYTKTFAYKWRLFWLRIVYLSYPKNERAEWKIIKNRIIPHEHDYDYDNPKYNNENNNEPYYSCKHYGCNMVDITKPDESIEDWLLKRIKNKPGS